MKRIFKIFFLGIGLAGLVSVSFPGSLQAEDSDFKIDGEPVPEVVAKVNGSPIPSYLLRQEFLANKLMLAQQGRHITPEQEKEMARQILDQQIDLELVYQKARLEGVLIPSDIVRKEIEKIKDQFPSEKLFESALKAQGMDRAALWEKLEKHLVAENYLRRAIAPQVDVDESDAQAFYNENPSRFTQPEMYEVRHIFVNAIDPSREGTADRPEDQEKADRIVKAVNEASREKIDQALKELEQGADFEELVQKYSEDEASKKKGGLLGVLHPDTTVPAIAEAMTQLEEGETSGVIHSSFGFHILQLDKKVPQHKAPFKKVKADIMNLLLKQETERLKDKLIEELKKTAEIKTFL